MREFTLKIQWKRCTAGAKNSLEQQQQRLRNMIMIKKCWNENNTRIGVMCVFLFRLTRLTRHGVKITKTTAILINVPQSS